MTNAITEVIKICDRHAERLNWAMAQLQNHLPFSELTLTQLSDIELAVLDQFAARFGKLQKKIGAIPSAEKWLLIREVRNCFSHDYPDDPKLQAAMLNKSYGLASQLIGH